MLGNRQILVFLGFIFLGTCLFSNSKYLKDEIEITFDISKKGRGYGDVSISRKFDLVVLDSNILSDYKEFSIPEDFDYLYHNQQPSHLKRAFGVSWMKPPEVYVFLNHLEVKIDKEIRKHRIISPNKSRYEYYDFTDVSLTELSIGDTLSVSYSYVFETNNNTQLATYRVFFNEYLEKDEFTIKLNWRNGMYFDYKFNNIDSTLLSIDTSSVDFSFLKYQVSNLKPLREVNSHAYVKMPHLNIFQTLIPQFDETNFSEDSLQIALELYDSRVKTFINTREHKLNRTDYYISKFSAKRDESIKTNKQLRDYFKVDSLETNYQKVKHIVNTISDNFSYNDGAYFYRTSSEFYPKCAEYSEKQVINNVIRYDQYIKLLGFSEIGTAGVFPLDKRIGEISPEYFRSVVYDDYLLAANIGEGAYGFILPLSDRNRYYLNELPFYYEGTRAYFNAQRKNAINDSLGNSASLFQLILLPKSTFKDNSRKTMMNGVVENNQLVLNGQIALAGQFSTLTRNLYRFNIKDETINPEYNEFLWGDSSDVMNLKYHVEVESDEFPFPAKVFTQFNLPIEGNKIELSKLINHVSIKNLSPNRVQPYFPDFEGSDSFFYMLNVGAYESLKVPENINIDNDFASYGFNVKEQNGQLMVSSILKIKTDFVEAKNIHQVKEIYDAIEKVELGLLKWN